MDNDILAAIASLPTDRRPDPLDLIRCVSDRQLHEALGVSNRTGDRMKAIGDWPDATQLSERRVGYRLTDICAWLDKRRKPSGESQTAPARGAVRSAGRNGS